MVVKLAVAVVVFAVTFILIVLIGVKAVIDMLATLDFVQTKYPKVVAWSESKASHGALLLVCACLLIFNAYELTQIEFPIAAPPPVVFVSPPPSFRTTAVKEPPNSLRRRTVKLAREITAFWNHNPPPAQQPVSNPSTDDDRQRNAKWDLYWRTVQSTYNAEYRDRVIGIIREYKSKGVPTGWLEQAAENHPFGASAFTQLGSPTCWQDELCQFREMSFHVDPNDQLIRPDF